MAEQNMPHVNILAEDNRLVSFCLKIVMKLGIQTIRKKIVFETVPRTGAGFTWVHRMYPDLIKRHRARAAKAKSPNKPVAFVVGLDSDNKSFAERAKELDQKLEANAMLKRSDDEQIVLVIPRRNIETWVMYFTGSVEDRSKINEQTDYKNKVKNPDFEATANGFIAEFREWKTNPSELKTLPALLETFKELERVMA